VNLRQTWLNDLGALTDGSVEAASVKWLSKHIRTFGKMFRRLQQLDKNRFVNLPNCTPLVLYYWNQVVLSTQAPVASVQGQFGYVNHLINTPHSIVRFASCDVSSTISSSGYGFVPEQSVCMGTFHQEGYSERNWCVVSSRTDKSAKPMQVMPASDVQEAVKILVTQFIPLKMTDLQEWEQNPEQWVNEEDNENDQWEYELRVSHGVMSCQ
jgi:hypothetical protein